MNVAFRKNMSLLGKAAHSERIVSAYSLGTCAPWLSSRGMTVVSKCTQQWCGADSTCLCKGVLHALEDASAHSTRPEGREAHAALHGL